MHLPNEIVLAVVRSLRRSDLKAARLVSQTWCVYASALLFKKIYVAPNKLDFEAFEAITQHPTLSKCVRRLVYDGTEFIVDCTKTQYIADLRDQTNQMLVEDDDDKYPLEDGHPECIAWIQDSNSIELQLDDLVVKWQDANFITQGYLNYCEHARYQRNAILSGDFTNGLVQGLARLPSLESVTLEGKWPCYVLATLNQHRLGSPLARTWDPFHPCPRTWYYGYDEDDYSDGVCHYHIITTALARAKKQIHEFAVGRGSRLPGIHPFVFDRSDYTSHSILGLDVAAFGGLRRLYLKFARHGSGETPTYCENIGGLQKLLASLTSLQHLDLILPMDPDNDPLMYRLDEVFLQYVQWLCLERMSLQGMISGTTELLNLVLFRMPALNSLEIGEIKLQDGTWEAVIEFLKQCRHLSTFEIALDGRLLYNDADSPDGAKSFEYCYEDIEDYVKFGGRHPCLKHGQLNSAANLYMMDEAITPALRERIASAQS